MISAPFGTKTGTLFPVLSIGWITLSSKATLGTADAGAYRRSVSLKTLHQTIIGELQLELRYITTHANAYVYAVMLSYFCSLNLSNLQTMRVGSVLTGISSSPSTDLQC